MSLDRSNMRELDKQSIERLDSLIEMGKKVSASLPTTIFPFPSSTSRRGVSASLPHTKNTRDEALTQQWLTMSLSFLSNRLGQKSEYYTSFYSIVTSVTTMAMLKEHAEKLIGVLLAARSDIQGGVLLKIEQLVRAEAFADIHEQATHLFSNGYKDAAAVLFGAVLESALRKLCERQGLAIVLDEAIDSMNTKLASGASQLYGKLVQKQITAWADIRNNAAHGHFVKYSEKDVEDMGKWISNFLQEHKP